MRAALLPLALALASCLPVAEPADCITSEAHLEVYGSSDCAAVDLLEHQALEAFAAYVPSWSPIVTLGELRGWYVEVGQVSEASCDWRTIRVAADSLYPCLAHELAHAIDGCLTPNHEHWTELGIWHAIEVARAVGP